MPGSHGLTLNYSCRSPTHRVNRPIADHYMCAMRHCWSLYMCARTCFLLRNCNIFIRYSQKCVYKIYPCCSLVMMSHKCSPLIHDIWNRALSTHSMTKYTPHWILKNLRVLHVTIFVTRVMFRKFSFLILVPLQQTLRFFTCARDECYLPMSTYVWPWTIVNWQNVKIVNCRPYPLKNHPTLRPRTCASCRAFGYSCNTSPSYLWLSPLLPARLSMLSA